MKRFSEQLHKKATTIKLTASERAELRERLMSYMEYHPVMTGAAKDAVVAKTFSDRFYTISIPRRYWQSVAAFAFVAMFVVVPTLAERAVPGDMLYPIKIQVNEEVRSTFASEGYEKIAWETERLERRISEARLLAKEGRLTADVEADVIAAVQSHKTATEAEIATLRENDGEAAALATLTLTSVLNVQSAALRANGAGSTTEGMSTVLLASVLDDAEASFATTNQSSDISYERLVAQLERETTRGRELLASINKSATDTERRDIERRLADVERKVGTATNLAATDSPAAIESLRRTWRDMQVLITFMTDIDVRSTLAINELVPIVLTPEEEQADARVAYDTALGYYNILVVAVPELPADGLKEKFALTLPQVATLLDTATTTLTTDSTNAKTAAETALAYTTDMMESVVRILGPIEGVAIVPTDVATSAATTTATTSTATSTESTDENEDEESEENI